MISKLSFEDLMNLFLRSQKNRDYDEVLNINKEFERRVNKRKLMGKKPIKTSMSGYEQTRMWLEKNSKLKLIKKIDNQDKKIIDKIKKKLRSDSDIKKRTSLW